MQDHLFCRLAACVVLAGAISVSCTGASDNSGTGGSPGAGTGGSTTGTGGTTSTGGSSTGGTSPTGTGGTISPGTGGTPGTGGSVTGTGGRGVAGTGGAGGSPTTGAGGTATGGSGSGGSPPTGGQGVPGNYPLGNPPVKSAGCGDTMGVATVTSGGTAVASGLATSKRVKITSGGQQREFIIDIPTDYDPTKPYKLFLTFHWIGSTDTAVATGSVTSGGATNWGFYGLHRMATGANAPAIFVAPQALPGNPGGTWSTSSPVDQMFVDDILSKVEMNLCIDTSRVFATGFSFGGMMTYSMSTTHQRVLRAAVGIAPANYNIYLPNPIPRDPIAWMSTTGMSDGTCPYDAGNGRGAKYIALGRGADNGCMVPATIPTWTSSSPTRHVCYDFQGCKSNYPVKTCTFNGVHQAAPYDSGSGDNGVTSWIPTESWAFFSQF